MPLDPQLDPIFQSAADLYGIKPEFLKAVALTESSGNVATPDSNKGARGLMQIMPETAKYLGVTDPNDPAQAIPGAARYLAEGLLKTGTPEGALGHYYGAQDPGYINGVLKNYRSLTASPAPVSGVDQLAAARGPMPAPGAVATNVNPPPGTPDTLETAPTGVAQMAALAGHGIAPGGTAQPGVDRLAGAPMPLAPALTNALGNVGAPQATRVAQAGAPDDIDALLAQTQKLFGGGGAAPVPAVTQPPASSATVPPPLSAPPGQQVNPDAIAESIAKIDRNNILGRPSNPYDVERVKLAPGLSGDPQQQWRLKQAETLAAHSQQIGPAGVENMPNSVQADAERAAGIAEAQQAPVRKTQGERPAEQRGAGSSVTYPPGSTGAQPWIDAKAAGKQTPAGVRINDDGSVEVGNINVPPEVVHQRYEALAKLADEAEAARTGQFESGLLRQKLIDIGTSGPITEQLGKLSALATQWGVPQKTIDSFNIPKAATVEQANKLSIDLLGSILHQRYPQRITNNDIVITKPSVAGANNMLEASLFMLDQVANPSFQRAIERYGHMAGISAQDPQLTSYYKELDNWNNAHSFGSYAKSFKPGMYSEAAPATTPAAAPSQSGPAVAVPSQQPPVPGATMGADGNWHVTIGGKSHTLVPPKP